MEVEVSDFEGIHPGRCMHLQLPWRWPWPSVATTLSVSVVDAPADFQATAARHFAAILVPRGRELDWIFCTDNGLWNLLFSASVSRLVLLRRQSSHNIHNHNNEEEEKEEGDLLRRGHAHSRARAKPSPGTSQPQSHEDDGESFKKAIAPLLHSLFPWRLSPSGPASDPFVSYEDHVRTRLVVEICKSPTLGNILVEDVELDCSSDDDTHLGNIPHRHKTRLRRRMRFQQMPNLIQTEVPIAVYKHGQPDLNCGLEDVRAMKDMEAVTVGKKHGGIRVGKALEAVGVGKQPWKELEVRPDYSKLVHKYLPPIVAGLVLASPSLEACITAESRVRVLSIGLGGGALPVFLHRKLGFHVLAVDTDEIVVELARRHFGLVEDEYLQVQIKDGIDAVVSIAHQASKNNFVSLEMLKEWQSLGQNAAQGLWCSNNLSLSDDIDARMHVIIVDVNAGDGYLGLLSPPPAFLTKTFMLAARMALHDGGMLVMNVIPRDIHNFKLVVDAVREVFDGIYQIHNEDNHILFAFSSKIADIDMGCNFALKLMHVIDNDLFDQIEEVD